MNQRIQELAEQSTAYIQPTENSGEGWIFNKEKFAELIINEVFEIMLDTKNYNRCTYTSFDEDRNACVVTELKKVISDHFGIQT